jgi:hypothetical protein
MSVSRREWTIVAVIVVVGGGLMLALGVGAAVADRNAAPSADGTATVAEIMCERFIADRLKAPATADYTHERTESSASSWTVVGVVDAENAYGAKLRTSYVCEVRRTSGDRWELVDLDMS